MIHPRTVVPSRPSFVIVVVGVVGVGVGVGALFYLCRVSNAAKGSSAAALVVVVVVVAACCLVPAVLPPLPIATRPAKGSAGAAAAGRTLASTCGFKGGKACALANDISCGCTRGAGVPNAANGSALIAALGAPKLLATKPPAALLGAELDGMSGCCGWCWCWCCCCWKAVVPAGGAAKALKPNELLPAAAEVPDTPNEDVALPTGGATRAGDSEEDAPKDKVADVGAGAGAVVDANEI